MRRRDFLALTLATLPAPAAIAAAPAPARIEWLDVVLLDGRVLRADTLLGHAVVVEFWASWCPFCRRQNPHLQALYDAQHGHGLSMLTFSIDRDPAAARAYVAEHDYTFPAAMASALSTRWFGTRKGLPMLYVVAPDGALVHEEAGEMFAEDVAALARFAVAAGGASRS